MTAAIRTLLRGSIDYAGLFPPAGLDMDAAVAQYAEVLHGDAAWALGRFVLPASRLDEFTRASAGLLPAAGCRSPWRLAALAGSDPGRDLGADLVAVDTFNRRHGENRRQSAPVVGMALVDSIEVKAATPAAAAGALQQARTRGVRSIYVEIPTEHDPAELVAALARSGGHAKVRTGGVTGDRFPPAADLARFLRACVRAGVAFKATAGLHHPLRSEYPLSYAPDSPRATMFGFLNLFLAAALARSVADEDELVRLLEERSPEAFRFDASGASWRGHLLPLRDLEVAREATVISFGSCSFSEPIEELRALNLLQPGALPR